MASRGLAQGRRTASRWRRAWGRPAAPALPPRATNAEIVRASVLVGWEISDEQAAERLMALLRLPVAEGGRPHPTWRGQLPKLRRLALIVARAARLGVPVSQASLARMAELQRPGRVRVDGRAKAGKDRARHVVQRQVRAWEVQGALELRDDHGQRLVWPRKLPRGKAPIYWTDRTMAEAEVATFNPALRRLWEWAWAALRADAPAEVVRDALHDPEHGEARLRALCGQHEAQEHRRQHRERQARKVAEGRSRRCQAGPERITRPAGAHKSTSLDFTKDSSNHGFERVLVNTGPPCSPPTDRAGVADRRGRPTNRDEPSPGQLRRWVLAGRAEDTEGAQRQFDEVALIGGLIGEERPVKAWLGLANMAIRTGRSVDELIGEYQQRADEWRRDIAGRTDREPVTHPPVWVWRAVQYAVGDLERPASASRTGSRSDPAPRHELDPDWTAGAAKWADDEPLTDGEAAEVRERSVVTPAPRQEIAPDGPTAAEEPVAVAVLAPAPGPRPELRSIGRHRFGVVPRAEKPPSPAQIEEARRMAAEGLPVPERYRPWL